MKKIDFSKTGGMPFSQDRLNYMQTSYAELSGALADMGLDPNAGSNTAVRLTGMAEDGLGNISNGWFVYNGEIIAFTGGPIPTPTTGNLVFIDITTNTTNLTYNNAVNYPVIIDKSAIMTTRASATPNGSSTFSYVSLQQWGREKNFTVVNVSNVTTANMTGGIFYKKNFINNTLHVVGNLITTTSANIPTSTLDEPVCQLPIGYRPGNLLYWFGQARGNAIYEVDGSGNRMDAIYCTLSTNGFLSLALIKPASGQYSVYFNIILPLD